MAKQNEQSSHNPVLRKAERGRVCRIDAVHTECLLSLISKRFKEVAATGTGLLRDRDPYDEQILQHCWHVSSG